MAFQFHLRKLMDQGSPKPCPPQLPRALSLPLLDKPSPEIHHIHAIHIAMIFMACMVGVVMLLYTVSITLRNYYSRRHNHNHNHSRRNTPILFDVYGYSPDDGDGDDVERVTDHPIWYIRTVGLQQSVIDSITVFKYRKNEGLIDGTECSVCLSEFQEEESLRLLPKCSHAFHIPCIDTWLRSHKNCPLCRAPVVSDGNSSATDVSVTVSTDQHDSNVSGDETQNQETQIENFDGVAVEGSGSYHVGEFESIGNDDDDDDDDGKILPVRRSFSMDSSSASSVILRDVSVSIGKHGSGKFKRALQKKPVSMKNRKFLFSRHCRSQSSTLPL